MQSVIDNVIVRLVVYYAAVLALFNTALQLFPSLGDAIARERARGVGATLTGTIGDAGAFATASVPMTDVDVLVPIVLTLLGALSLSLPVALVYQWTREPAAYRRDFGRALVALPIAVALAVFLVKNSLALAFSLAGIVAAIRWRAALTETMDGVFMFVVIGIGLAAGTQLLMVAFVASVLFNSLILTLARTGHAAQPKQLQGWSLVAAAAIPAEQAKRDMLLRVNVANQGLAEAHLDKVLALCAKRWEKAGVTPLPDGRWLLEYRLTLRRRCSPDLLRSSIADAGLAAIGEVVLTTVD